MTQDAGAFFPRDLAWHPKAYAPEYKTSVLRSPSRALVSLPSTLGDTTGPVFGQNMIGELDNDLILNFARPGELPIGERIILHGHVIDENAKPVPRTLVEIWQANSGGRYRHKKDGYLAPLDPNFGGFGRTLTDDDGRFRFRTIKPGPYPWPNNANDWRPSHIHFSVFGSGFAQRLISQLYFEGDPHIRLCPIVNTIKDPAAIEQLTAKLDMNNTIPMDARAYRLDIVLRGRRSTMFENRPEGN
ncbi:protocatechuate 3,4-dioxygenase subunit beta [Oricola cellulosilytica]|uniref:Protocatechuate 3,4-dioxygenase subunit beta n=1 Tax=Oricola cellulosilytica TaxID=1429082 RepID=A0A4R0PAT3_9HYPH|nr:protocatechuate 3,4-dioxygenase subunit beta [Oricola cellulosilytica]TCD11935.1 protocatechuate 3,4-dioxygenase subunit beta [Oricola cellulosilytica]